MVSESESTETKKPPVGGFTTLLIALIILYFPMVPGAGLEPAQRERRGILNRAFLTKKINYKGLIFITKD